MTGAPGPAEAATWRVPNVCDLDALSESLSQILLIVENLNAIAVEHMLSQEERSEQRQKLSLPYLAAQHYTDFLRRKKVQRARTSQWLDIFASLGHEFAPPAGLVAVCLERLASRYRGTGGGRHRARNLVLPEHFYGPIYLQELGDSSFDFATHPRASDAVIRMPKELRIKAVDESIDPLAVIQDFLIGNCGVREETVDHFVQAWLRHVFGLHYNAVSKSLLLRTCRTLNEMFYGAQGEHSADRASMRGTTIGVASVIERIRQTFGAHAPSFAGEPLPGYQHAVGIFLSLRLCGLFRYQIGLLPAGEGMGISDKERAALHFRFCVSPQHFAEPGFVRTRVYGALTGIPGLQTIFRGGLLPHTNQGRAFVIKGPAGGGKTVFALKMVADAAYRGRLGIYISVEENLSAIADRLMSFGMLDPQKFLVVLGHGDMTGALRQLAITCEGRGLLILYSLGRAESTTADPSAHGPFGDPSQLYFNPADAIRMFASAAEGIRPWKWRAVVIDSLNAMVLRDEVSTGATLDVDGADTASLGPNVFASQEMRSRIGLRHLADTINASNFWGILISELGGAHLESLSYVVDTVIELGFDRLNNTRWLRVDKCRTQDFQPGEHHFRLSEGDGIRIFPSLYAVQSSLRRRTKATLSQTEQIWLPEAVSGTSATGAIRGKSSTLITGPAGSGKTQLMLHLLTSPMRRIRAEATSSAEHPQRQNLGVPPGVLLVTFRSSPEQYRQRLRNSAALDAAWDRVTVPRIRYFSPGTSLSAGQLVDEIRRLVRRSRRESVPIERIAFDEIDAGLGRLPGCTDDPMFWHTITELTAAYALTSFFVLSDTPNDTAIEEQLRVTVDYVFDTELSQDGPSLALTKSPDLTDAAAPKLPFAIAPTGSIVTGQAPYTPDGRRLGSAVAIRREIPVGRCALQIKGCLADDRDNELRVIRIGQSSRLEVCEYCLDEQVRAGLWIATHESSAGT